MIHFKDISKTYFAPGEFTALDHVSFSAGRAEFIAIVGKSGSGKSTLINLVTGIDYPTSGEVLIGGKAVSRMRERELSLWRGKNIGIVFQFFQLLPTLTVAENVMLPMDFCNSFPAPGRRKRALMLLEKVGIAEQADKLPSSLSGGQQQRAAIARALANDPPVIAADEPTGNLDTHTSREVLELFAELRSEGKTVIMVTHERDITPFATREITLVDGAIRLDRLIEARPYPVAAAEGSGREESHA